jgi:hypothetical protein
VLQDPLSIIGGISIMRYGWSVLLCSWVIACASIEESSFESAEAKDGGSGSGSAGTESGPPDDEDCGGSSGDASGSSAPDEGGPTGCGRGSGADDGGSSGGGSDGGGSDDGGGGADGGGADGGGADGGDGDDEAECGVTELGRGSANATVNNDIPLIVCEEDIEVIKTRCEEGEYGDPPLADAEAEAIGLCDEAMVEVAEGAGTCPGVCSDRSIEVPDCSVTETTTYYGNFIEGETSGFCTDEFGVVTPLIDATCRYQADATAEGLDVVTLTCAAAE